MFSLIRHNRIFQSYCQSMLFSFNVESKLYEILLFHIWKTWWQCCIWIFFVKLLVTSLNGNIVRSNIENYTLYTTSRSSRTCVRLGRNRAGNSAYRKGTGEAQYDTWRAKASLPAQSTQKRPWLQVFHTFYSSRVALAKDAHPEADAPRVANANSCTVVRHDVAIVQLTVGEIEKRPPHSF